MTNRRHARKAALPARLPSPEPEFVLSKPPVVYPWERERWWNDEVEEVEEEPSKEEWLAKVYEEEMERLQQPQV